jgi:hypothetical protein
MRPALNGAQAILQGRKNLVGAEVGVLRGENAREILREWNNVSKLWLIDNYKGNLHEFDTANEILLQWRDRYAWIIDDSVSAASKLPELDFAYIDGDHSYNGVKRDIETYWPKLKNFAVLCGHDYNPRWESLKGIIQAVDEFAEKGNFKHDKNFFTATTGSSSDWWFLKDV